MIPARLTALLFTLAVIAPADAQLPPEEIVAHDGQHDFDWEIGDGYTLILLSYEGGRWRDVTKTLLPVAFNKKLAYKLPRRGRSIEVTDEEGHKLYTLTWRNDRFRIK